MNEELTKRTEDVMLNMLSAIDTSTTYGDDETSKAVKNFACLYELRQKDLETELHHDEHREKLAYDNGRLDMELRVKEANVAIDRDKLDLETKKFETSVEQEREQLKNSKAQLWLQAIGTGLSITFRTWLASSLMYMDATGHVVGSMLGRATLGKWVDRADKL